MLFVDDEPAILSGLGRMLRPLRDEIQGEFASSAAEALSRLERETFDVVIADIRMPVMDGAAFLDAVARAHPHIIRMVLSAHADVSAALRTVPVAQQFLAKPCDAASLRAVVQRAVRLHRLLHDHELLHVVASLGELPVRPKIHAEISRRLAEPNTTATDIAKLIERDEVLMQSLLRCVNRPFFGLPRRIASIESAIGYIGTNVLRALILDYAVRRALEPSDETRDLFCANLAMQCFSHKHLREDAFTAALLRDIGGRIMRARGSSS
ncbi:MAG TPA: HDOD domain-containing protein, partial [Polyangiales bacterium]|nr:HDOD domain-containing protein [Polyangiales bacterium]